MRNIPAVPVDLLASFFFSLPLVHHPHLIQWSNYSYQEVGVHLETEMVTRYANEHQVDGRAESKRIAALETFSMVGPLFKVDCSAAVGQSVG